MRFGCNHCGWRGPEYELLAGPGSPECPACNSGNIFKLEPSMFY